MASCTGSLLESMIEDGLPISLVLVDKPCKALGIAEQAGVSTEFIDRCDFGWRAKVGDDWDREGFTQTVSSTLQSTGIDLVAMAGFMTVLHPVIFTGFPGHILNIHPALLPLFKGDHAVADALAAYKRGEVTETGTTIHIATERLDDERWIIRQVPVPIYDTDDKETLHERIKEEERQLYPAVLRDILNGVINLSEIKERS